MAKDLPIAKLLRECGYASDAAQAAGRQALAILEGADGPLSPTEISQRMFTTTASTTSLLEVRARAWATEVIEKTGLPPRIFPPLRRPGEHILDDVA